MADSERTTAALQALFADNHAGAISAQDLRDFLVTALGGYAMIYVADGSTAQTVTDTAAKLTAFAANGPSLGATPAHASDQITIGTTGVYWVEFSADVVSDAEVAAEHTFALYANGAAAGGLKSDCPAVDSTRHVGFAGPVSLSAGDIITVYVGYRAGLGGPASVDVTTAQARLAVKRIG
jgi:hypothetical protein